MASKKQIADLHAQLTLYIKQYVSELMRVDKLTKSTTSNINRGMAQAASYTSNLTNAQQAGSKAAARFGVVMQQSGYQLQDFAVQVAAGQNALVAFSQQGSQLLGILGPAGAIAGAALAVGTLMIQLDNAGKAGKAAAQDLRSFDEVLKSIADRAKTINFDSLTLEGKKSAIAADVQTQLDNMVRLGEKEAQLLQRREALQRSLKSLEDAIGPAIGAEAIRLQLGTTDAALKETQRQILIISDAIGELGHEQHKIEKSIAAETSDAVEESVDLVQNLEKWHHAGILLAEEHRQKLVEQGNAIRDSVMTPTERYSATVDKLHHLFKQGVIDTETFTRALQIASVELDKLIALDVEQRLNLFFGSFGKTTEQVTKQSEEFKRAMDGMWNDVSDRGSQALAEILITGENVFGGLADIVARSVLEITARLAVINPMLNAIFGGTTGWAALPTAGLGSILGGIFGGGKAAGGPVQAGHLYMINEKGDEMFMPGRSGTIIPAERTAKMMGNGGGGPTVFIDAKGADQAAITRLWNALAAVNASVEHRSFGSLVDRSARSLIAPV